MKRLILFVLLISMSITVTVTSKADENKYGYLSDMKVEKLWEYSSGENQTIAFIDTGITNEVRVLYKDRIVRAHNIIDDNDDVTDKVGHGTEVISIACGDWQKDIFGIAKKSAIMPIKAVADDGSINATLIVKAIDYAIQNNASIVNLIFGSHVENDEVKQAITRCLSKNITVVVSSGDYGQKELLFPSSMEGVISVEALDTTRKLLELSNMSETNVATFPGVDVSAISLNNTIKKVNGTSYSNALASGYIGIMRGHMARMGIDITNDKIMKQMKLVTISGNNTISYVQPIEDFNYRSFTNRLKYMMSNKAFLFYLLSYVAVLILILLFIHIKKNPEIVNGKKFTKRTAAIIICSGFCWVAVIHLIIAFFLH